MSLLCLSSGTGIEEEWYDDYMDDIVHGCISEAW